MKRLYALLPFLLAFACLFGCIGTPESPTPGNGTLSTLNAVTFSIGKADATLIYTETHAILIDAGETEDAAEILRFMQRKGIEKLDAFFITHFDKDHVGGAAGIIEGTEIGAIYTTYEGKESVEVDAYHAALTAANMSATVLREVRDLTYGDIHLKVYPPEQENYALKDSNNSSLVLHMTYGETRFLFAADAMEDRLAELLDTPELACDLLKVPYHGNDIENLPEFLALVNPAWGIVTCSEKNPEEAGKMADLRAAGVTVLLTRYGDVEFSSDGKKVTVQQ